MVIFIGLLLLPAFWRFALSLWSSIFQLYTISVFGFYPSLALLATLSLIPGLIQFKRTLLQPPIFLLILLMALQLLSLLWSPNRHLGLATVLYEMPFLILYVSAFHIAKNDPTKLYQLVKVYAILSLAPLIAIILFTVNHDLNQTFLESKMAKLLINPNTLTHFLSFPGHHVWNGKPNGFFTNQNVGGGYLGICALFLWGISVYYQTNWLKIIAALHWATIFLTFSFAASGLAILLPLLIASIYITLEKNHLFGVKTNFVLGGCWGSAGLIAAIILLKKPGIISFVIAKIKSRFIFWKVAALFIPHHIILGLGFGGWATYYEKFRTLQPLPIPTSYLHLLDPNLPPHNSLIILWSQSGVFAALVGLLFMISLLWFCWSALKLLTQAPERLFVLCVTSVVLWMILQGMGENWGVLGEMHIQPILALSFGLMMGLCYRKRNPNLISIE